MKTLSTLVVVASFAAVSFAHADEARTVSVRYTASDTASVQASRALYSRLHRGAEKACQHLAVDARQLWVNAPYQSCVQTALSNAVAQVNRPLLSAYAAQRGVSAANATSVIAANH